ncbi:MULTISPECIES: UDP-N-acetylmuramoyl-L-alanyl-D-glutamate--2,6-diaminopimelate ligase [unclassified Haematospirillum]|uniref:UDP-N-acetylmuramoyl-L-alanyl-D-glutamate--2, 6-diaminopimelate ligase n=1 Tax=unclassified Haematospirillum TaxID=2622088 RepID=UPI00143C9FBF|nr:MULTISPECIES: UDP-N-acetylmuramoyl-L-alanyl-D-glutamate--2,6-diaminopimelate ligase [unclassified Haematospirillum]NKD54798.1 UDP-N-acetylmuramoyl-L-alanyl-D-glutamate--2,6-diaminopimelate ligase [Haematospirillum sp. H4890]NKD74636.1 UDP-N-acetylmuramoyl-L-alanyl-D-glutamate--2,6-diaminopimelate ligase [Haematospirillum sp. H4485]
MLLGDLAEKAGIQKPDEGACRTDILGITADSRLVKGGFLFAAMPGTRSNGQDFIADALQRGAVAILAAHGTTTPREASCIPVLGTDNPRRDLPRLASAFYARQPETTTAVTGTNGKTSTAVFFRQIMTLLGRRAASLGTLGLTGPDFDCTEGMTTPDPVSLHRLLAMAADRSCSFLCLEASSHGLDQFRLDAVRLKAAAFTNLSRDHLDYHGSMEAYRAAKTRLFTDVLEPGGLAVLNADSPDYGILDAATRKAGRRVWSYGRNGHEIRLLENRASLRGQALSLDVLGNRMDVDLPLTGHFQAMNSLAALGLVLACDRSVTPAAAVATLPRLTGVPGRLEYVGSCADTAAVYVDYAHTPDSLEQAILALRPHTQGRLIVLFGCGGDRDPGKRSLMGEVVHRLADGVILTDDNPRTEDPAAIRADARTGCPDAVEIGDRGEAIRTGIAMLRAGDVLLLAGKGHESGQTIGAITLPFDDRHVAREALKARMLQEMAP